MIDVQSALAAPIVTRREDYSAPDWLVPDIALEFDLDPATTRVKTALDVTRNGDHDRPLRLHGDGPGPLSARVDGNLHNDWRIDGPDLVIDLPAGKHRVETEVEVHPDRNTQL